MSMLIVAELHVLKHRPIYISQLEEKNSHHGAHVNNYRVYVYSGKIKGIVSRYKGCVLHQSQSVTNVDIMYVQVLAV